MAICEFTGGEACMFSFCPGAFFWEVGKLAPLSMQEAPALGMTRTLGA